MSKSKAPALAKGLNIIDLIRSNGSLSFLELQELTADNPASLSRYLHTLLEKNYIIKSQLQKYELGLKLIDLKDNKSIWPRLKRACYPFLKEINDKYGVTVILLAYSRNSYVAIDKVIALDNLGMMEKNTVGNNNFSSIWSNLFYSELNGHSIESFIDMNSITGTDPLLHLKHKDLMGLIINQGYLTYYSNNHEIYRIGIPIYYQEQVIATIGIGTFVNQLDQDTITRMTLETLSFSQKLSTEL